MFIPSSQIDVRPLKIDHLMNTPIKMLQQQTNKEEMFVFQEERCLKKTKAQKWLL